MKKSLRFILVPLLVLVSLPATAALVDLDYSSQCEVSGGAIDPQRCNKTPTNDMRYGLNESLVMTSGRSQPGPANGPIDVWGVCRYVDNKSANISIFVPFKTAREWLAFLAAANHDSGPDNFGPDDVVTTVPCARPKNFTVLPDSHCQLPVPLSQTGVMIYDRVGQQVPQNFEFTCTVPGLCNPVTNKCGAAKQWTQTVAITFTAQDSRSDYASFFPDDPNNPSWIASAPTYFGEPPAPNPAPIDAQCGPTSGLSLSSPPTSGLCASGIASVVQGSGPWSWSCLGEYGGDNVGCTAGLYIPPINGQCGSAHNQVMAIEPVAGLCATGIATAVSGTGPWSWQCLGSQGGSDTTCDTLPDVPIDPCGGGCQGGGDGGGGGGAGGAGGGAE